MKIPWNFCLIAYFILFIEKGFLKWLTDREGFKERIVYTRVWLQTMESFEPDGHLPVRQSRKKYHLGYEKATLLQCIFELLKKFARLLGC